jgi:hypothetical protein
LDQNPEHLQDGSKQESDADASSGD